MTEELHDRLDQALDALAGRGPKSSEVGLRSFPAASDLKPLVEAAAQAREALSAKPSPQARAKHLLMIMDAARAYAPQVEWGPDTKRRRRRLLRPIVALAAIGALALAPTMAFAANAEPGDALYGTKLAVENMRLFLETETSDDVRLHLEFASVRLSELSKLIAENRTDDIGKVMSNLAWHNRAAERGMGKMRAAGEDTGALEAALTSNLSRHVDVLTSLSEKAECDPDDPDAGDPQCKGLLNAIERSSKVLEQQQPGRGSRGETGPPDGRPQGSGDETSNGNRPASPGPPAFPPGR